MVDIQPLGVLFCANCRGFDVLLCIVCAGLSGVLERFALRIIKFLLSIFFTLRFRKPEFGMRIVAYCELCFCAFLGEKWLFYGLVLAFFVQKGG